MNKERIIKAVINGLNEGLIFNNDDMITKKPANIKRIRNSEKLNEFNDFVYKLYSSIYKDIIPKSLRISTISEDGINGILYFEDGVDQCDPEYKHTAWDDTFEYYGVYLPDLNNFRVDPDAPYLATVIMKWFNSKKSPYDFYRWGHYLPSGIELGDNDGLVLVLKKKITN